MAAASEAIRPVSRRQQGAERLAAAFLFSMAAKPLNHFVALDTSDAANVCNGWKAAIVCDTGNDVLVSILRSRWTVAAGSSVCLRFGDHHCGLSSETATRGRTLK